MVLVPDPTQSEKITKNIDNALLLSTAKRDAEVAGRSDVNANLYYVIEYVKYLLTSVKSYLQYLITVLGSVIVGLFKGLSEGGLWGGLKGAFDGFAIGSIKGFGGILSNSLASGKPGLGKSLNFLCTPHTNQQLILNLWTLPLFSTAIC